MNDSRKDFRAASIRAFGVGDSAEVYAVNCVKMFGARGNVMTETIEAVFDGAVFRPVGEVELKPNTQVEITVTIKNSEEKPKTFRVRSKHLGIRQDLNYDKTNALLEEIEGVKE